MKKYKYVINGKIHPENVNFSIKNLEFAVTIDFPEFSVKETMRLNFHTSSVIYGEFESEKDYSKLESCNLATLRNLLHVRICAIVDRYCFIKSYDYETEISKIQCIELGIDYTPDVRGELNVVKNSKESSEEMIRLISLLAYRKYNFLNDVFIDFRLGIRYPYMTGIFCYRAIEILRRSYFDDTTTENEKKCRENGWVKLRDTLDLDRDFFQDIEESATRGRHGDFPSLTYLGREKIMNKTRLVIDRLIDHIEKNTDEGSA